MADVIGAPMTETAAAVASLLARHEKLPARAAAAANVLRLADDPDTSANQLALAVATDPVLAAKLLRVANSTYYGLGGRVSTLAFAVSVVGFRTVRTLAVAAAAGLDGSGGAPDGFWASAATAATAAELIAPLVGAHPGDAFSLGLLHTLGAALLHQCEPLETLCLPEPADLAALARHELEVYGITHSEAAGRVLAAWHFPDHVCELIARHHEPLLPDCPPLERCLHTARAMTDRLLAPEPSASSGDLALAWLTEGRLAPDDIEPVLERVSSKAQGLLEGLQSQR